MEQRTGLAATLSILSAVGSYIAVCTGHAGVGLLLAILAMPLGLVGLLMAASPRVSGGILSIVAIGLGLIGVIVSVLGLVASF